MKWYKVFRSKEEAVQAIPENSKRVIRLGKFENMHGKQAGGILCYRK
jgi:hypothetical protein